MVKSIEGLDFETALQFIIDDRNETIDTFNDMADEVEKLREDLLGAQDEKSALIARIEKQDSIIIDAAKVATEYRKIKPQFDSLSKQSETKDRLIKTLTNDLKAEKEKVARHLKANAELRKTNDRLTKTINLERKKDSDPMPQMPVVYEVGDEMLFVHPQIHRMSVGNEALKEQAVLLFTDSTGVYLTASLDANHSVAFSSPTKRGKVIPERTVKLIHNNCISPSKELMAFAQQWLYRVNVEQKSKAEQHDLIKFTGEK